MSTRGPEAGRDEPGATRRGPARDHREPPVLPDRAAEDGDTGWGDRAEDDDERWLAERPPHWG